MIVTPIQDGRQFVGQLDPGQDIVAGLRTFCRENGVKTAWLFVTAALRNPTIRTLRPDGKGFGAPSESEGLRFFASMQGNVSLTGDTDDIRLYGHADAPDTAGISANGQICSGEVAMCEFLAVVSDQMALVRQAGQDGAWAPWVQVRAPAPSGPVPSPITATTPYPTHPRLPPDEAEINELNILDIREGDFLDHARFGMCKVVRVPKDDKVTVRLPTGKLVDLHLGVMTVSPLREMGGRRVFSLEVRKR